MPTRLGLGFFLSSEFEPLGPNPGAFGHGGAGGSLGVADPEHRLSFGYVMNLMHQGLWLADPWLRSEGAPTVIAAGVSLNVGITGLVIEAVNRCYRVVVARDCVAGWPLEYGELVLEKTIAQLATLASAEEIAAVWSA